MSPPQTWEVRARFVALSPPFQGRSFPIVLFPAVIGRGTECEVLLDAVSISRQHAVVEEKGGRFRIRDLGSRNGIKLADQPVHDAVLNAGDIVTIGDIQLRFEPSSAKASESKPAAGEAGDEATRAVPRTVTGQEIVALAQSAPAAEVSAGGAPAEGEPESQPRVGLNMKMIAVVIGVLVLSVIAGVVIVRNSGAGARDRIAQWPTIMVKVGEKKWIELARGQYVKLPSDVWWTWEYYGDNDIRKIIVGGAQGAESGTAGDDNNDPVASVERYDQGQILVTGKSVGETGVTLWMSDGRILTMRIIVRGRIEDPLEPLLYGLYPAAERIAMAKQFLSNGELIEKERPYLALQEYEKAKAVLTPLPNKDKGELNDLYYLQIVPRLTNMQRVVDDRWSTLDSEIRIAAANKDLTHAIELLQKAVRLIPDPNDPRHQMAQGALQSLIRRQLQVR